MIINDLGNHAWSKKMEKIRVGMSSCLMGINVRYDGGHKLDSSLIDTLEHYFKLIPICPEVECRFGNSQKTHAPGR